MCLFGLFVGLGTSLIGSLFLTESSMKRKRHPSPFTSKFKKKSSTSFVKNKISIIIPCLNEASNIRSCINHALQPLVRDSSILIQILVVDGGSTDDTCTIVESFAKKYQDDIVTLLRSPEPGRSYQQNFGALAADGEFLLFLHADTLLPTDYDLVIRQQLKNVSVSVIAFALGLRTKDPAILPIQYTANFRSKYFGLPYGDQGLAMRHSIFLALDGFPHQKLMEDFEFVRMAAKRGTVKTLHGIHSWSDDRRYVYNGPIKNTLLNQFFVIAYSYFGYDANTIYQWYYNNSLYASWFKKTSTSPEALKKSS